MRALPRARKSTLADSQSTFAHAVRDADAPIPASVSARTPARAQRRFNIYRNNVYASLTASVLAKFPVVETLVGRDFAAAMARVFVERQPPVCQVLLWYGAAFPDFIESFEPARPVNYLADIARLEWAIAEALSAPDAAPVSSDALADFGASDAGAVRLRLHPSLRMVRSAHPICSLWTVHSRAPSAEHRVSIEGVGEAAMIIRPRFDVRVIKLECGVAAFVESLASGATLDEAIASGFAASAAFDLSDALITLFSSGAVVGLAPPQEYIADTRQ